MADRFGVAGLTPTNVHDALIVDIDVRDLIPAYRLMRDAMQRTISFAALSIYASKLPLTIAADPEVGWTLGDLEEMKGSDGWSHERIEDRLAEIGREVQEEEDAMLVAAGAAPRSAAAAAAA